MKCFLTPLALAARGGVSLAPRGPAPRGPTLRRMPGFASRGGASQFADSVATRGGGVWADRFQVVFFFFFASYKPETTKTLALPKDQRCIWCGSPNVELVETRPTLRVFFLKVYSGSPTEMMRCDDCESLYMQPAPNARPRIQAETEPKLHALEPCRTCGAGIDTAADVDWKFCPICGSKVRENGAHGP
ncbi:hypothetical protein M885DRAFT_562365 [Pelagophyceae sp. CCMP2097]|nr:hypothetical protein M885DRAFT_562365 [Pelagophyceae sp. CCMP2097]